MALLGNYSVIHKSPARFMSGTSVSSEKSRDNKNGSNRNRFMSFEKFNATPSGYTPPYCFVIAQISGGLASYKEIQSVVSFNSPKLDLGINIDSAFSASISITQAQLDQIVSLVASITGSISITSAELAAVSELVASITASMAITDAQLGAIVSLVASLSAAGSLTANNFATSAMSADISSLTALSPETLAAAIWNSLSSDYNAVNTMGEKLNDAGSAANPWTEIIEGSYTATEVLRLLLAVASGKTTITDNGNGTAVVRFRDLADSKNRIVADMTGSVRTTVTRDVT